LLQNITLVLVQSAVEKENVGPKNQRRYKVITLVLIESAVTANFIFIRFLFRATLLKFTLRILSVIAWQKNLAKVTFNLLTPSSISPSPVFSLFVMMTLHLSRLFLLEVKLQEFRHENEITLMTS